MGAFPGVSLRHGLVAAAALGLAMSADRPASAEAAISGTPDAIRLEASNTTLQEVLSALGNRFGLVYQSAAPLDRRIDGIYVGELSAVLRQLLKTHDFVLKHENEPLSLLLIAERKSAAQSSSQVASESPNTRLPGQSQAVLTRAAASAVKSQLQTRLNSFARSLTSGVATRPLAAAASAAPTPNAAAIAQLIQRSNGTLQSLRQALILVQPKL